MYKNLKSIWRLGLPLSLTFVIQMVIITVDSLFAGNISHVDLAAVALSSSAFYIFLLLLIGFEVGSSVRAGQALGAGDERAMLNSFRQGIVLCLVFGVLLAFVMMHLSPAFLALGQDAEVVSRAESYMQWFAWTLPVQSLVIILRGYFAVIDNPWASVRPVLFVLVLNGFLDYCLSQGNLGFPNMGIAGIGLASLISNLVLLGLMLRNVGWGRAAFLFRLFDDLVWKDSGVAKLFLLSLPISVTMVSEEAFFSGTIFLAGSLGASEQAAHQILFNSVGTSYLFNTGIAMACAILIGKYVGAKKFDQIIPVVKSGLCIAIGCTLPFALVLIFFTDHWIYIFLDESLALNGPTIFFAKSVIAIAVLTLFIDTVWLVGIEALHGMLDTAYPAGFTIIAYWLIGGPIAYWACQSFEKPFSWIWYCILIAGVILAILVTWRLRVRVRQIAI